eukprot:TRINITY_DN3426_c2_g1_i1.p1 TRINITY_DN3426_c2_g1~~TRINITY_DN3426_c2_g1_i1.p1  ORF type:complete len:964 (-),score=102.02 TRINITY_DN3426_c2_g1_i1:3822-6713(-)
MSGPEDFHQAVTFLARGKSRPVLAAGYADGSVLIYDPESLKMTQKFSFHSSAVTCLCFDKDVYSTLLISSQEYVLFSGSKDTTIIGYDLIASSSLFKLTRHKDVITSLQYYDYGYFSDDPAFAKYQNFKVLISSSKDSLIKIWDINGQYSIDTALGFTGGITGLTIAGNYLLATSDYEAIKVYELKVIQSEDGNSFSFMQEKGEFKKPSKERTIAISYYKPKKILIILSKDGSLEMWRKNGQKEISRRMLKSRKRKIEKTKEKGDASLKAEYKEYKAKIQELVAAGDYDIKYLFSPIASQALGSKAHAFFVWRKSGLAATEEFRAIIGYSSNTLELWSIKQEEVKQEEALLKVGEKAVAGLGMHKIQEIGWWGHKTPIRTCLVSSNDQFLLTASTEAVKVWNVNSLECTKTLPMENVVCGTFLPGDKYAVLGSKEGYIYIIDTNSLEVAQKIEVKAFYVIIKQGHNGEIWSLTFHPNPDIPESDFCIMSGAADKSIKLWTVSLKNDKKDRKIRLILLKKLETTDDVLCSMISPNGKLIAFSLLDSTIKVQLHYLQNQLLFANSLKFYLSLYGHKLPVLSFDISTDNTLLVSGSSDKNIKIWGLDFGDCHKSLLLHKDAVTGVKFVKDTHYFFTCSKDRTIKYIDADKYEQIMSFTEHHGEVWAISLSSIGDQLFSVSADKSVRVWRQTNEQMFLEEEKEKEAEGMILEELDTQNVAVFYGQFYRKQKEFEPPKEEAGDNVARIESAKPVKSKLETLKYGEDLIEALDLADEFKYKVEQYAMQLADFEVSPCLLLKKQAKKEGVEKPSKPEADPIIFGQQSIFDFVLSHLKMIPRAELESALRFLPYTYVERLLYYLEQFVRKGKEIELSTKCLYFVLKAYEAQLSTSQSMTQIMYSLNLFARSNLKNYKVILRSQKNQDMIGFNMQALKMVKKQIEIERSNETMLDQIHLTFQQSRKQYLSIM